MFLSSPVMGEKLGAPLIFYKPTTKLCKVQLKTWENYEQNKKMKCPCTDRAPKKRAETGKLAKNPEGGEHN